MGGVVVPLLEDDLGYGADKPVVHLISSRFGEKDVSAGWRGFAFLTERDEKIMAQRGDVKFILIQVVGRQEEQAVDDEATRRVPAS